jgi:hypothetical protein
VVLELVETRPPAARRWTSFAAGALLLYLLL